MKKNRLIFDIHSHIIPNVDDGSSSLDESINMIKNAISAGCVKIMLTPHYRDVKFETPVKRIKYVYDILNEKIEKDNLDIDLLLGQEIYIKNLDSFKNYLEEGKIISLNNTNYYLLEFNYNSEIDIGEVVYNASLLDKKIIIAHVERYNYINKDRIYDVIKQGALIQVNASSIVGRYGKKIKRKVLNYIKDGLVSFIASDCHENRDYDLSEAYDIVYKKFGYEITNYLFYQNANDLLS